MVERKTKEVPPLANVVCDVVTNLARVFANNETCMATVSVFKTAQRGTDGRMIAPRVMTRIGAKAAKY
jgi:hypothetical protein